MNDIIALVFTKSLQGFFPIITSVTNALEVGKLPHFTSATCITGVIPVFDFKFCFPSDWSVLTPWRTSLF